MAEHVEFSVEMSGGNIRTGWPPSSRHPGCSGIAITGCWPPTPPFRSAVVASTGEAATFPQTTPPRPVSTLSRQRARSHSRRVSSRWAALLAGIHHARPAVCPECGESMRLIAFLTDAFSIRDVLSHLGEPLRPPAVHPARGPPELEFGFAEPAADGMDQTPAVDPA